jgi:protein-tyrosine kinase
MSRIHDALTKAEKETQARRMATVAAGASTRTQQDQEVQARTWGEGTQPAFDVSDFPVRRWTPDPARLIFTDASEERLGIEQLRSLRSRVYQLRAKTPIQTIVVSSALGGEGKTLISANFAMALAKQLGKRVLLIDADLRKPGLHEVFGAPAGPGLTEYLSDDAEVTEVVQGGVIENLWLLPAGVPASNAAELLGNRRLAGLLERLTTAFDWIILDSSPVLPVSDAAIIARCCDAVLLVARAEVTPYDSVQRAQHEFRETRVLGLVLNGVAEPSKGSYYYGGYGYGK